MNHEPDGSPSGPAPMLPLQEAGSVPPPPWPLWQRLAFRYLLLHFVLYTLPGLPARLLGTVGGLFHSLAEATGWTWLDDRPFRWLGKWGAEMGKVEDGWQGLTTWLDANGWAPYEVIHQPTGSGDTAHDIAKLLLIAAVATLLTAIWSLIQRRPCGHPCLGRWLHLVVRFELAFTLLGYGLHKFYGGQFGELSLSRLTQEIGDTWPMTMVGTFMQASKPYELFGGGGEVLGGLLLFHRRTALIGAFVTIGVMTNVCALNWLCGVPVKLFSAHLLLSAAFLLAPYGRSLWALFVRNRPTQPVDLAVPAPRRLHWPLRILGHGFVVGTLLLTHVSGTAPRAWMKGREKSELYGLWLVEKMLLDGREVPVADATRWRFFAIDRGSLTWAREASGVSRYFDFTWDATTGSAQVKPRNGDQGAVTSTWTIERGTKIAKVDPPLPLRNEDRSRKVDGERRSLVIKGRFGDQLMELHTVEKVFRLQTGFRLRQELPDFW